MGVQTSKQNSPEVYCKHNFCATNTDCPSNSMIRSERECKAAQEELYSCSPERLGPNEQCNPKTNANWVRSGAWSNDVPGCALY